MTEDLIIRKAIQVIPVDGERNKYKLTCEYPIKDNVNLAYIYDVKRSNKKMAVASSLALRRKLFLYFFITKLSSLNYWCAFQRGWQHIVSLIVVI